MKGSAEGLNFTGSWQGVILKCPLYSPFIPTLAAAILDGSIWNRGRPEPHELPKLTIYLPARAPVEALKLAFLALAPNGATFLPRIRVLGEADPLDLFAAYGPRMASTPAALALLEKALAIPPAFSELERQVQLAALVMRASQSLLGRRLAHEPVFTAIPAASAFTIAGQIAALIGEAHTEGADFSRIAFLDRSRASGSEQLSSQLLRGVLRDWDARKASAAKLDSEERRNRLMAIEAEYIRQSDSPVIIAGSTGSVAATIGLMEGALGRPQSALVLYGLDDTAATVEAHPEHPQYGLQQLLARLNVRREDVRTLTPHPVLLPQGEKGRPHNRRDLLPLPLWERAGVRGDFTALARRARFLSEALRPPPETAEWPAFIQALGREAASPAPGLSLIEADTIQDEAAAIALILRHSLEVPGQTAAVVTPSDSLLSRVRHALGQWTITADAPSEAYSADTIAIRAASCAASDKPEEFVELLRQAQGPAAAQIWRVAEIIDLGVLRQMWRPASLAGIPSALARAEHATQSGEARHTSMKRIGAPQWEAARSLAVQVIETLSPFTARANQRLTLPEWVAAHRAVLSHLEPLGLLSAKSSMVSLLEQAAVRGFTLNLADYSDLFARIASERPERTPENPHPRLFLLKPLDARLLSADTIVLAGLNEGCWPQTPGPDPWLNRADRAFVGLPPQERRIGRSAHDFFSLAASAPQVILTRSKKENGSLTRPSRWVSRIKALAEAGKTAALNTDRPWLDWVAGHGAPGAAAPATRPRPRPPLAFRPRRLSVTAIENWFANPYAIYARRILDLEPLRRLDETSDARDKGILYHAALHAFFQDHPGELPQNAAEALTAKLDKAAEELGFNLANAPFWRPRFVRFAEWFAATEGGRREGVQLLKSEVGGKLVLPAPAGPFEITARADRIDRLSDGSLRIYDFKTSANTAKVSAGRGAPQLALEGLLAKEGAFAGIPAGAAADFCYIVATGGEPPGEIVPPKVPAAEAIEAARKGTLRQIDRFDDEATPYTYETRAVFRDKAENDPYAHLARVREWAADADDSEADDE
ncbi:MAG: PD-(D/E)XK nuclease family protein [Rhodomicrobium sp.]